MFEIMHKIIDVSSKWTEGQGLFLFFCWLVFMGALTGITALICQCIFICMKISYGLPL